MKHTLLSAAFATMLAVPALANDYMIMAPAAPGGGWDGTARAMQEVMQAEGISASVQVQNVPGAGGTVGLAQFAFSTAGDASQLIVGGYVMVGAILTNESPVSLADVTPIARLTEEAGVIVVPANGKIKTWQELEAALKANPKAVSVAGGSAGGGRRQAGDDDINCFTQCGGARRFFGAAADIFGNQRGIEITHRDVMAVADQAAGELATNIAKANKTDLHPCISLNFAKSFG